MKLMVPWIYATQCRSAVALADWVIDALVIHHPSSFISSLAYGVPYLLSSVSFHLLRTSLLRTDYSLGLLLT
jgi:hypothetical protein